MEKIEEVVENVVETQSSSSSAHSSDSVIVRGQYKKEGLPKKNQDAVRNKNRNLIANVDTSSEVVEEICDDLTEVPSSQPHEGSHEGTNTHSSLRKKSKIKRKNSKTISTASSTSEILERSEDEVLEVGTTYSSESIATSSRHSKGSSSKQSKDRTKSSRTKSRVSLLTGVLEGLEDDLVEDGVTFPVESISDHHNTIMEHNICERVFIQNRRGFEAITSDKLFQGKPNDHKINEELNKMKTENKSQEFALFLHNYFRQFSSFCHGILAGFGICHASLVLSISVNTQEIQNFAVSYPEFARLVQVLYYFLTAVCLISVLDRCDVGGVSFESCGFLFHCRFTNMVTVICYSTLLVMTVVAIQWDDKFALSSYNEDLWRNHKSEGEFSVWRILSMLRGLLAVLGYAIMCFGPDEDLFYEDLSRMVSYNEQTRSSQDLLKC